VLFIRNIGAVTAGVFHSSGGATKDTVEFGSQKLAPHVYELTLVAPLAPGQYGIIPPGATTTSNLAAGGKIYRFSISLMNPALHMNCWWLCRTDPYVAIIPNKQKAP
jgi:hypothetical protein